MSATNKIRRQKAYAEAKAQKTIEKSKLRRKRQAERAALGAEAPEITPARTIDNTREADPTLVLPLPPPPSSTSRPRSRSMKTSSSDSDHEMIDSQPQNTTNGNDDMDNDTDAPEYALDDEPGSPTAEQVSYENAVRDAEEVAADQAADEFASHFARTTSPRILVTTSFKPSKNVLLFIRDILTVIPNSFFAKRGTYLLKDICKYASNQGFTHLMVWNEDKKKINALWIIHLPGGPTAKFRVSSVSHTKDIPGRGRPSAHRPELILNGFVTRLGHTIGRLFGSMFPQDPEFHGRRVVTIHNQRDFLFFRHHRYVFHKEGKAAELQELGPRFTLKLRSLQSGTFNSKAGEYDWVHNQKLETSRRKFFL